MRRPPKELWWGLALGSWICEAEIVDSGEVLGGCVGEERGRGWEGKNARM